MESEEMELDNGELNLTCVSCQAVFEWSFGEQEWYAAKGLNTQKRCRPCRQFRREQRDVQAQRSSQW